MCISVKDLRICKCVQEMGYKEFHDPMFREIPAKQTSADWKSDPIKLHPAWSLPIDKNISEVHSNSEPEALKLKYSTVEDVGMFPPRESKSILGNSRLVKWKKE